MRLGSNSVQAVAVLLVLMLSGALAEEEGPKLQASATKVLFVFDASQSMYGKLKGASTSKLNLAKGLMRTALESWPAEIELGLMAYGHRGRRAPGGNRCRDIEMLVPVGPGTASVVQRQVQRLSANGTTPLCRALKQASDHFAEAASHGHLVLISDGTEECGGDLVETVRVLAIAASQLTVDVLSLGQTTEQNVPLRELVHLTGGRLYDVRTGEDATVALEEIVQRLAARCNLSLSAHDLWDDDHLTETPLSWELYARTGTRSLVATFAGPRQRLCVTPGLYWVVAQSSEKRYGFQVHVPQKKSVTKRLSLKLGDVELQPVEMVETDRWSYQIRSVMPGNAEDKLIASEVGVSGTQVISLPHGYYRVIFQREGTSTPHAQQVFAESERRHVYDLSFAP